MKRHAGRDCFRYGLVQARRVVFVAGARDRVAARILEEGQQ